MSARQGERNLSSNTEDRRDEAGGRPLLTVIVPLIDTRGDAAEHIRSWTLEQSLAHERYQVIVAAPPGDPELQRRVGEVLTADDRLLMVDSDEVGLYDAAAARATGDWLLPTESHCLAHRDCLAEVVAAIERDPELKALTLEHGHIVHNEVDRLCARWFGETYDVWERPEEWTRLNLVGFVIRRDAYFAEGGLDRRYGLFCSFLLAARMDLRGARIRHLATARVDHVHTHGIREHHEHTADYAYGACEARASLDADFCERYFGHAHTWANAPRLHRAVAWPVARALCRGGVRALRERPRTAGRIRELVDWLMAATFGIEGRLAWRRRRLQAFELFAERLGLPGDANFRLYLRALDEIGDVTELEWIRAHADRLVPGTLQIGRWPIERLNGELVPIHGLETHATGRFRWTEPACLIRCAASSGELRIDTGGLRGPPLGYLRDAYVDSRRIPRKRLSEEGGRVLKLPWRRRSAGRATVSIALICKPLLPAREGSTDARRLGMPVFSLELAPAA